MYVYIYIYIYTYVGEVSVGTACSLGNAYNADTFRQSPDLAVIAHDLTWWRVPMTKSTNLAADVAL